MSDEAERLGIFDVAIGLGHRIFALTGQPAFRKERSLAGRLESTAISVPFNIAKGLARETALEQRRFFHVALGTSGEARVMLSRLPRTGRWAGLRPEISDLKSEFENIHGQLTALVASLQSTETRERGRLAKIDRRRKALRDDQPSPQRAENVAKPGVPEAVAGDGHSPRREPAARTLKPPPQDDTLGAPGRDPKPGAH